jgi:hypothetical protein
MKHGIPAASLSIIAAMLIAACAAPSERRGQRLFAGCPQHGHLT